MAEETDKQFEPEHGGDRLDKLRIEDDTRADETDETDETDEPDDVSEAECLTEAEAHDSRVVDGNDHEGFAGHDPLDDPASWVSPNRLVAGVLTLHYPERDVKTALDGDSALRLLTMFARRREDGLADHLDPDESTARAGWLVLDLSEVRAMSWWPVTRSKPPRTVIDPPLPDVA